MSTETLLTGHIKFMPEVPEEEVRKIAHELEEYTETEPKKVMSYEEYMDLYRDLDSEPHSTIIYYTTDEGIRQYELEYNYVNWSSHIYEKEWNEMVDYLIKHGKKISEVHLSVVYIVEPDLNFRANHEKLTELRVEQVAKKLLEDDEDE